MNGFRLTSSDDDEMPSIHITGTGTGKASSANYGGLIASALTTAVSSKQ
jgi:hypothetical protein